MIKSLQNYNTKDWKLEVALPKLFKLYYSNIWTKLPLIHFKIKTF